MKLEFPNGLPFIPKGEHFRTKKMEGAYFEHDGRW